METTLHVCTGFPSVAKNDFLANLRTENPQNTVVYSFQEIRDNEFNGQTDKKTKANILTEMKNRSMAALDEGKNVIFEIDDIPKKQRNNFLLDMRKHTDNIVCTIAAPPLEEVYQPENLVASKEEINEFMKSFQPQSYFEGWDKIEVIGNAQKDLNELGNKFINETYNVPHENPNHAESIGVHSELCFQHADVIGGEDKDFLIPVAKIHDIGKPLSKTYDDKGNARFFGHESYGAYIVLSETGNLPASELVSLHMRPYAWMQNPKLEEKDKETWGPKLYQQVCLLHQCDKAASIPELKKEIKIVLAPSYEQAKEVEAEATVEAEYGAYYVEGKSVTLAHHGPRSNNPAPCNADVNPIKGGTILVSHIDLDTIGGCLALMGEKPKDDAFWQAAEFIDVNGPFHMHELDQPLQDKLNAYYAWEESNRGPRCTEITDVTEAIKQSKEILNKIIDEKHPEHEALVNAGREWEANTAQEVEKHLYEENDCVRAFVVHANDVFCSASYYSPNDDQIKKSTVVLNQDTRSITVAFADGGKECRAVDVVQELWGPEAGGHYGIAGSPRNWDISKEEIEQEFIKTIDYVTEQVREQEQTLEEEYDYDDEER